MKNDKNIEQEKTELTEESNSPFPQFPPVLFLLHSVDPANPVILLKKWRDRRQHGRR
jgi:hypothetical protein